MYMTSEFGESELTLRGFLTEKGKDAGSETEKTVLSAADLWASLQDGQPGAAVRDFIVTKGFHAAAGTDARHWNPNGAKGATPATAYEDMLSAIKHLMAGERPEREGRNASQWLRLSRIIEVASTVNVKGGRGINVEKWRERFFPEGFGTGPIPAMGAAATEALYEQNKAVKAEYDSRYGTKKVLPADLDDLLG